MVINYLYFDKILLLKNYNNLKIRLSSIYGTNVFLILLFIFWTPAIILLIVVILNYINKIFKKSLLIVSLISFFVPFIIIIISRINEQIKQNNFEGHYTGKDNYSNQIKLEIKDHMFKIVVDNCDNASIKGTYQYVKEYDSFLFYAKGFNISIYEGYHGYLFLNSDIKLDCTLLNNVQLKKIIL